MNSRERVITAIEHRTPDRVPVDFGAHRSSGIMAIAYRKLRDYIGLPEKQTRVFDVPQQLAVIDEDILDLFHIDAIEMSRVFCTEEAQWKAWTLPDGSACRIPAWIDPLMDEENNWVIKNPAGTPIATQKKGMLYFDAVHWPLKGERPDPEKIVESFRDVMWISPQLAPPPGGISVDTLKGRQIYREESEKLRASSSRAIVGFFGGSLFEIGQWLFGIEDFFMMLAGEPEYAARILDTFMKLNLERMESYLEAVGPNIDILAFSDDFGMQTGPEISPSMFHDLFKPRYKSMWNHAKELAKVKVMLHSCGSLNLLLDDMIDAGLDIVNPVQISSADMEPLHLKEKFGKRITFWGGGCDTQKILSTSSPQEIREHVLKNLEAFSPGGGYVFQQVHNIMADVPPENIVAMFNAVSEFNGMDQVRP